MAGESSREYILGQLLKEMMEHAQLSQRQLGRKLSPPRPQSYVYRVLTAKRRLDVFELLDWCDACDVPWLTVIEKLHKLPKPSKISK